MALADYVAVKVRIRPVARAGCPCTPDIGLRVPPLLAGLTLPLGFSGMGPSSIRKWYAWVKATVQLLL
jgi:hypothetical protein